MKTQILEFLLTIPYGKVTTYKAIGEEFGIHPRSVARILASNAEQDKYPCYKVINSNGKIGGYNLGLDEKTKKLSSEGIEFSNGKIANEKLIWKKGG